MTFREALQAAEANKVAIGHFNVSDLVALDAVVEAAKELHVPVMVGVSEGEREFIGVREIAALVQTLRKEHGVPIFLNADHTHTEENVRAAAEAGFDEILFDGSKLPFEENVRQTKKAVEIVKLVNREIIVEGEIGYIGSFSEIMEKIPEGVALSPDAMTSPEEAARFVRETGIEILAPAVGNMHGLVVQTNAPARPEPGEGGDGVQKYAEKHLDIKRIKAIKAAVNVPLTLHGGSGTADEDFTAAIDAGITIIHVNTELRLAWRRGVEEGLRDHPKEIAPYKILPEAKEEIKKIVLSRLKLFNRISR